MFQKHRVEVITFTVAFTFSLLILGWMEYQKPNHGFLAHLQPKAEVRNRHTGEVLLSGATQRAALLDYMAWIRIRRAERERVSEGDGPMQIIQQAGEWRGSRSRRRPGGRLENADLRDADLSGADLSGIRLRSAYCEGADFQRAHLNDARLEGAVFDGANFREAMLSDADLSEANLSNAVLVNVLAQGGIFQGADFTGSDLSGGDFSGADLTNANLADVKFDPYTSFTGANLENARHVSESLRLHAEKSGARFQAEATGAAE